MLIVTRLRNHGPKPWFQFRFINCTGQSLKCRSLEHSGKEQQGSVQDEWLTLLPPSVEVSILHKGLGKYFLFFYSSSTCSPVQEHLSQHLSAASKTSLHKIESFMDQRKDYSSQSWTKRWPTEKFYLAVFSKCPPPWLLGSSLAFVIANIYWASLQMAKYTSV